MQKNSNKIADSVIRPWSAFVPDDAIGELAKVLKSKWLNTGKKEGELRVKACRKWGLSHCVAVNSCTSALRASLAMLGIGFGDEVITTPYTFIATNTAILEQGAIPVFADIKYDDLNIDPKSIEANITPKTKAIIVVHYGGNSCDLDEIRKIGRNYKLPIIEDAAHAMGSKYKGKYIGAQGELVCFSFQAVKIITSGDGGLIATTKNNYYQKLKRIIWYGVDREAKKNNLIDPLPKNFRGDLLGFKYNMNDITATLAAIGLDHFEEPASRRLAIGERYRKELSGHPGITLLKYYKDRTPNYQIFPIHVENRLQFAKYMRKQNIVVNINNRRNDIYPIFGGKRSNLPMTEMADQDVILLPIHADLTNNQVDYIIKCVQKFKT